MVTAGAAVALLVASSLLTSGAMVGAIGVAAMTILVLLALERPLWIVYASLLSGGISLAFLTENQRSIFASLGGVNLDGARLVSTVLGLGIALALRRQLRASGWLWTYVAFLAWAGLSLTRSAAPMEGLRLLAKLTLPFLVYLVVGGAAATHGRVRMVRGIMLAGGVLVLLLSASQYAFGAGLWHTDLGLRFRGTSGAAATGMYMGLLTVVAVAGGLERRGATDLALASTFFALLLTTVARTPLAATFLAIGVLAVGTRRYRLLAGAATVAVLLVVAFSPLRRRVFRTEDASLKSLVQAPITSVINTQGREVIWPATLVFWTRRPWTGGGLGSTWPYLDTINPGQNVPHNEYLRLLAESGVVGLALWVLAYGGAARDAWRRMRSAPPDERGVHAAAVACVPFFLFVSIFDNALDWYMSGGQYVWALLGLSLAAERASAARAPTPPPKHPA